MSLEDVTKAPVTALGLGRIRRFFFSFPFAEEFQVRRSSSGPAGTQDGACAVPFP